MPRGPRLDAARPVHHLIARGIDRQAIFHDDRDREELLRRLSEIVAQDKLKVYAWALMPNHFHLLVRMGERPLEHSMRSLLTGFVAGFNRRHERLGPLFQDRYNSIVCRVERQFRELVRYIHLNPLRAGLVRDLDELESYPYTGHSVLLATVPRSWQSTAEVLECFGRYPGWARAAYRQFVSEGVPLGESKSIR